MKKTVKIGNRLIGEDQPCFIVAEISCNHLQKKNLALRLISKAKQAGADAVKFQTYTPDTMTLNCDNKYFRIKGTIWEGQTLYNLYEKAYTPWKWFPDLAESAKEEGLIFFSTPFDETAVDFLEKLRVPAYKIASFEITHIPFIKYVAAKQKPIILSTGVATKADIDLALKTIQTQKNDKVILMKCTSAYPAPLNEANLKTIPDMEKRFGVLAGLSDHTINENVPAYAVALGAKVIEKHFTLEKKGPDAKFSINPHEFAQMVTNIRRFEEMGEKKLLNELKKNKEFIAAAGRVRYASTPKAKEHRFLMRSIFIAKDILKGEKFTRENMRVVRPAYGLHPRYYEKVLGKKARMDLKKGSPLSLGMVAT